MAEKERFTNRTQAEESGLPLKSGCKQSNSAVNRGVPPDRIPNRPTPAKREPNPYGSGSLFGGEGEIYEQNSGGAGETAIPQNKCEQGGVQPQDRSRLTGFPIDQLYQEKNPTGKVGFFSWRRRRDLNCNGGIFMCFIVSYFVSKII